MDVHAARHRTVFAGRGLQDGEDRPLGGKSGWLQPRLVQGCERLKTVSAREFTRALRNNIPKMMFIFLPLIALVNLVLYAFRRRTYVEHLLFYVHFHAFAFLLLTLQIIVTAVLGWTGTCLSFRAHLPSPRTSISSSTSSGPCVRSITSRAP